MKNSKPPKKDDRKSKELENKKLKYFGSLKNVFGDGLTYQKNIRKEWD